MVDAGDGLEAYRNVGLSAGPVESGVLARERGGPASKYQYRASILVARVLCILEGWVRRR